MVFSLQQLRFGSNMLILSYTAFVEGDSFEFYESFRL